MLSLGTKSVRVRSLASFEPPAHIVTKPFPHAFHSKDFLMKDTKESETRMENIKSGENDYEESKYKKYYEHWKITGDGIYDPAAKLLVISIRWLHGVASFVQIKASEQAALLHYNWKELFVLTAVQYSYYFDEGKSSPACIVYDHRNGLRSTPHISRSIILPRHPSLS